MRAICVAVVALAAIACGKTTSNQPGPSSQAGSGGADIPAEGECERLGVAYRQGCDDCPREPIDCPCFHEIADYPFEPLRRCNFGNCVLGVDCAAICAGSESYQPDQLTNEFGVYLQTVSALQSCVQAPVCPSDDWCSDHGKCVRSEDARIGSCFAGAPGDPCLDADDCSLGRCVLANSGFTECSAGQPGAFCGEDGDCAAGWCALYEDDLGLCTTGALGDPCNEGDCEQGTSCVSTASTYALGTCLAGELGDACDDGSQCQSGSCVYDECNTGEVDAICGADEDCRSGFCLLPYSPPGIHSTCVDGEMGSPCYGPDDCQEGVCALARARAGLNYVMGLCSPGGSGDPCVDDGECQSEICTITKTEQEVPGPCAGKQLGDACGDGDLGVCDGQPRCQYGKCE